MKMKHIAGAAVLLAGLLSTSCGTVKDIVYMQNDSYGVDEKIENINDIKVQPQDQVSIIVSCKEPELVSLFNLKKPEGQTSQNQLAYTVNKDGEITFPVLGQVHVAGMNRDEIAKKIADMLKKGNWVSDPTVVVDFANLHFSVLGEVGSPGSYSITNDRITLLEGLAMAGDLTEHGERDIVVVREKDGVRTRYVVDLRDKDLFSSPVYYLQQNDVIYVKPDNVIARQAADNPNNLKSIGLWMSICSFVATMAVLIFK